MAAADLKELARQVAQSERHARARAAAAAASAASAASAAAASAAPPAAEHAAPPPGARGEPREGGGGDRKKPPRAGAGAALDITMGGKYRDRAAERRAQEEQEAAERAGARRAPARGGGGAGGGAAAAVPAEPSAVERALMAMFAARLGRRRGMWLFADADADAVFAPDAEHPCAYRAAPAGSVQLTRETAELFRSAFAEQAQAQARQEPKERRGPADAAATAATAAAAAAPLEDDDDDDDDDDDIFQGATKYAAATEPVASMEQLARRYAEAVSTAASAPLPAAAPAAEEAGPLDADVELAPPPPTRKRFAELSLDELLAVAGKLDEVLRRRRGQVR